MDCAACQGREEQLERLEMTYIERSQIREDAWLKARPTEFGRLRSLESDALLALEIARADLYRHKQKRHKQDPKSSIMISN
jgi:hypothetical protein